MIICHHFLLSLNNFIQLFFSGSADSLLKKNAEPILHIAGLDVTIVKVQDRSIASHRLLLVCSTCHNLFSHTTGSHSKQILQPLLHYQHNNTESSITTMLSPQKKMWQLNTNTTEWKITTIFLLPCRNTYEG